MTSQELVVAKHIGNAVGWRRRERGLSMRRMALLLEVDPSLPSHLEAARRLPSLGLLYKIADVLKCRAGDLLP